MQTPAGRRQLALEQQQRILLLRHAAACQLTDGHCPAGYPHCPQTQALWAHLRSCRRQKCNVEHCQSSRYVLAHFDECRDSSCPVCGPVDETIRNRRAMDGCRRWPGPEVEPVLAKEEEADKEELEDFLDANAENDLCCPISLGLFRDPVVFTDGHTYDRAHILRHIRSCTQRTCMVGWGWVAWWGRVGWIDRSNSNTYTPPHTTHNTPQAGSPSPPPRPTRW